MAYDVATRTYNPTQVHPQHCPGEQIRLPVKLKASTTFPAGSLLAEITATPGTYDIYDSGTTGVPKCVLSMAVTTNASGVAFPNDATNDEDGSVNPAPYFTGVFLASDVPDLDAAAITAMGAKVLAGVVADGTALIKIA